MHGVHPKPLNYSPVNLLGTCIFKKLHGSLYVARQDCQPQNENWIPCFKRTPKNFTMLSIGVTLKAELSGSAPQFCSLELCGTSPKLSSYGVGFDKLHARVGAAVLRATILFVNCICMASAILAYAYGMTFAFFAKCLLY